MKSNAPPRHVGLFVASFAAGGTERFIVNLSRGLADAGVAVDVVAASPEGPFRELLDPRVNVVDLNAGSAWRSLRPLCRYLGRIRPDILLSAGHAHNIVAVTARRFSRAACPVIVTEHLPLGQILALDRQPKMRAVQRLIRWAYPAADAVVAPTPGVADELAGLVRQPRSGIQVIPNPAVGPMLYRLAGEECALPWPQDGVPYVMSVGRLDAVKDFRTLIRAFSRVRADRPVRLLIAGEGDERETLEAEARALGVEHDVYLPGFRANPYNWVTGAAVFVVSSIAESFSLALAEAMALGVAVVSTDCPYGPPEILEDGRYGRLVPMGDDAAMADAIIRTLDAPPDTDAARSRAEEFTVAAVTRQYLSLMSRLTGAAPPPGGVCGEGGDRRPETPAAHVEGPPPCRHT